MGLLLGLAGAAAGLAGSTAAGATTLGTLSTVAGLAGTGLAAGGAIQQGQELSAEANYQAQVQKNNEVIANQYAEQATQTGETQSYEQGLKERQAAQEITAGIAAGGVDVNTGSAAQVRESQAELGMLDVATVRQQAAQVAYGYRTQATSAQAESQLLQSQAGFETTAGWLQGLGGLLSGAGYFGRFGASGGNSFSNLNPSLWGGGGESAFAAGAAGG